MNDDFIIPLDEDDPTTMKSYEEYEDWDDEEDEDTSNDKVKMLQFPALSRIATSSHL